MKRISGILLAVGSIGALGCGEMDGAISEETGVAEQALVVSCSSGPSGSTCVEYTDGAGLLTVRIKTCPRSPAASGVQTLQCPGESGFSLIGGGGNVVGTPRPGALLTGSFLRPTAPNIWEARFKTHLGGGAYQAQAYSISLKVAGWSATKLAGALKYVTSTVGGDGSAPAPKTSATLPSTYTLIGGGGYVESDDDGPGLLLQDSHPVTRGWRAGGAYHLEFDTGLAYAVAIGIRAINPDIIFASRTYLAQSPTVSTGYATSSLAVNATAVLSAVGGRSFETAEDAHDYQRFLTHLIPFLTGVGSGAPGAFVRSKDRSVVVPGYAEAHAVSLGAQRLGPIKTPPSFLP